VETGTVVNTETPRAAVVPALDRAETGVNVALALVRAGQLAAVAGNALPTSDRLG
jgi:hypothetical protein